MSQALQIRNDLGENAVAVASACMSYKEFAAAIKGSFGEMIALSFLFLLRSPEPQKNEVVTAQLQAAFEPALFDPIGEESMRI